MKGGIKINYQAPGKCPVCGYNLLVTQLTCKNCSSQLSGNFVTCKFCQLASEQQEFIEIFIKCRGNIKDVEKELNISYPTVRSKLDNVIEALGYRVEKGSSSDNPNFRQDVLDALEKGEITAQEAVQSFKKSRK